MYLNVSGCVKTGLNKPENVEKLRENVEKLRLYRSKPAMGTVEGGGWLSSEFASSAALTVDKPSASRLTADPKATLITTPHLNPNAPKLPRAY